MKNTNTPDTAQHIREKLISALTKYDEKESKKKSYNRNALGIYFARADEIMHDIESGATPRAAICAGFSGRVADACLRAIDLPITKEGDAPRGWYYVASSAA